MKTMVLEARVRRPLRASSMSALMSLMPLLVAENVTKRARVVRAMIRASVVFPEPGGPQKIMDGMRSASMALRRKRPGESSSSRPTISSRLRGRRRSASGASSAGAPCGAFGGSPKRLPVISSEEPEIEVATRHHDCYGSRRADIAGEQRREAEGARRFDDQLGAVHGVLQRIEKRFVVHADDVFDVLAD